MGQQQRSFGLGVGAGIAAGVAGAVLWAIITSAINARIGYLALGVGAGVGFAVGKLGKGPANGPLPIIAGVIALVSVALGDTYGWASELSSGLKDEFQVNISALDLFKGVLTGDVQYQGESLPVRELYKDEFDFFVLLMIAFGVGAAFVLCRRQLEEAAAPIAPPPLPPTGQPYGAPTGSPVGDEGQPPYGTPTGGSSDYFPPPASPDGPPSFEKRPEA
jgi:hypothetical protein